MKTRGALRTLVAVTVGLIVTAVGPGAHAVAAGCDSAHPTFIGGPIDGSPDHHALNVLVGVDQVNASGQKIDADGIPVGQPGSHPCGGYSWCDHPNPTLSAQGSADPDLDRAWGRCVSADVVTAYIEMYPKGPSGVTDKSRYGSAAHYTQPIASAAVNSIVLQLPVTWEAGHGNTGWAEGYLSYGGHRIPPEYITRFRAWTQDPGTACGIQGFSAGADELAFKAGIDATYYKMDYLAGGQCGAHSQRYQLDIDCKDFCGGGVKNLKQYVDVERGHGTRVDFAF